MDRSTKSFSSVKSSIKYKPLIGVVDSEEKVELNGEGGEENETETETLLPPSRRRGGLSRHMRPPMKVQWNDQNGNKLAEIREFQASDVSESDEEEDSDSCICVIM